MKIRVVTLPSPWQVLADAGCFSHGERFRDRVSTARPRSTTTGNPGRPGPLRGKAVSR